jgi:PAS domain S-box-containing protein
LGVTQMTFAYGTIQDARGHDDASYENFDNDIRAIFRYNYDVIYASDGSGITQKVSSACEELWGLKAGQMIGRSIYELEKEGVFKPSITRLVLETKQRVQSFQVTKTGRKLMVIGTPITDKDGRIIQVINLSRDISSEESLQVEMESVKLLLEAYKHELDELRAKNLEQNQLIYASEAMAGVTRMAMKVSGFDSTVLLTGESGVGKDVLASFIQFNGKRKDKQFIKINCGAIPENLLESELFGYEKGAFTGAGKDGKPGLFELASQGTLFLDEVAELPLNMQVKLLRVLQDGMLLRVGGTKPIQVDVRVIAATNRNLEAAIENGHFRADLYYRLNVLPIRIPALRERPEDILPLTVFFLQRYNSLHGRKKSLDQEAMQQLQEYHWPGNIRELQNVVERLVVLSDKDLLTVADLPAHVLAGSEDTVVSVKRISSLKEAVQSVERQLLKLALAKYGTTARAAAALGVDQSTVSRKLHK